MKVKGGDLNLFGRAIQRGLMDAHTVGEARLKEVVIASSDFGNGFGEMELLRGAQVDEGPDMSDGKDHGLKWPSCPPRAHHNEAVVLKDHSLLLFLFEPSIVHQKIQSSLFTVVFCQLGQFERGLFGQGGGGPYLTMRVGVGASHGCAFVLENLHPPVLFMGYTGTGMRAGGRQMGGLCQRSQGRVWRQVSSVDICPCLHNGDDLLGRHIGKSDVVCGAECEDIAFPFDCFSSQQLTGQAARFVGRGVVILGFLDCAIVIDKDKGVVVVGVLVARSAFVSRTEITFRVVDGEIYEARILLSALPWSLGAVRGDQDPTAPQRIIPAVGNVVEDLVRHPWVNQGRNMW